MTYNISIQDIKNSIVCSSFSPSQLNEANNQIYKTANYLIVSINKPFFAIDLMEKNK